MSLPKMRSVRPHIWFSGLKFCVLVVIVSGFILSQSFFSTAWAQDQRPAVKSQKGDQNTKSSPAVKAGEAEKPPEPEDVVLETKDGLRLTATFYPGTEGNQSVPVILLHMWKGSRSDYGGLAPYLQQLCHAVLVPDLRGHGESIHAGGSNRPLEAASLSRQHFLRMVDCDMEALKKFLMKKNNAGELNIEKLCLVGAEMGAVVALDWARMDWSWPVLNTGKQGQDVRALVLISPQWAFHGLNVKQAMAHRLMLGEISAMILVGDEDAKAVQQAKRFEAIFRRNQPNAEAEKITDRTLFYIPIKTSLQGTKMLGVRALNIEPRIAKFIELRLVNQNFPWKDRKPGKK